MPVTPNRVPSVSGVDSVSGLWLQLEAVAAPERGQVLMHNKITGFSVRVHYVGEDRGQEICVLR